MAIDPVIGPKSNTTSVSTCIGWNLSFFKGRPACADTSLEFVMKNMIAVLITTAPGLAPLCVGAQDNSGTGPSAVAEHLDEIVRMHQQVAAANREYDREVAAAKTCMTTRKRRRRRSVTLPFQPPTTA